MINKDFILGFGAGKAAGGGGGGGGLTLIKSFDIGTVSYSDTSQHTLSTVCKILNDEMAGFDLLLLETTRSEMANNLHFRTVQALYISRSNGPATISGLNILGAWNWRKENGVEKTIYYSTAFGIYVNTLSSSSDYYSGYFLARGNATYTGTLDGIYTAKLYGMSFQNA